MYWYLTRIDNEPEPRVIPLSCCLGPSFRGSLLLGAGGIVRSGRDRREIGVRPELKSSTDDCCSCSRFAYDLCPV